MLRCGLDVHQLTIIPCTTPPYAAYIGGQNRERGRERKGGREREFKGTVIKYLILAALYSGIEDARFKVSQLYRSVTPLYITQIVCLCIACWLGFGRISNVSDFVFRTVGELSFFLIVDAFQ